MASLEEIRRVQAERGIEFYFAQFVDMYARPSAKLIPAANLDDLVERRRRVRRLRRRRDRAGAERPGHRRDAGSRQLHACPVAAESRALRLRHLRSRARSGRTAHARSCAGCSRRRAGAGVRVQDRARARVLPRQPGRGRLDRDCRRARHAREALLRPDRPDPATTTSSPWSRGTATSSVGATTRTTTRTRTGSSSRTSPTPTR